VNYDPERTPDASRWLAFDDSERIAMVESWHRRARIRIPGSRVHAIIHAVVENQIALGESVIIENLGRLRAEGLSRHEAIHAIGSVLAEQIFHTLQGTSASGLRLEAAYHERVRRLTAADWLRSGSSS
jgi:hypothetical protein